MSEQETQETPKATVSVTLQEQIGLKDYSHIQVRAFVSRQIDDTGDEAIAAGLRNLSVNIVEPFLAELRQEVLDELKEKNAK